MPLLKKTFLLTTLLILLASQAQDVAHAQGKQKINVFTSLAPVSFLVEQIGGDLISINTLIPPGRDPHTFSPTPRQVVALSQAQIYFTVAMTFEEELMNRLAASHNGLRIVDCSAGVVRRQMDHDHYHQHHVIHGDPHIWLGIKPLVRMAENISEALSQIAPDHQRLFQENLDQFLDHLARLESELSQLLAPFKGRSFLVFHPSFGYFSDSFGLVQEAVEIQGKSPSPRQLAGIIKLARASNIRVIFVQPQFDTRAAERIAQAIDAQVMAINPLAANLFDNLRQMAEKIATALGT